MNSSLEDEEFSRALKEQQEAEEAARQRRNAATKRNVILGAIAAVVLLIAAGLWIRSSMNANALSVTARIAAQQAEAARTKAARIAAQQAEAARIAEQQAEAARIAEQQAEAARIAEQQAEAARIAERKRILAEPPLTNSIGMEFKLLPGGTFTMGEANGYDDETPHQVKLTQPFEVGVYEVTQEQYEAVMGTNPSRYKGPGPQNPVDNLSWDEAVEFCRKLSAAVQPRKKRVTCIVYRQRRSGSTRAMRARRQRTVLATVTQNWASTPGTRRTLARRHILLEVRSRTRGVFMTCMATCGSGARTGMVDYPSSSVTDPTGPVSGSRRVLRGGSFPYRASYAHSADRLLNLLPGGRLSDYIGFRPARTYHFIPLTTLPLTRRGRGEILRA